ncbi:hypothetical protein ALP65_02490 [Pseudomonas aeruginosa]|uniref:N-acetyltransferase domain-containing protein n=7 Tax=Gammaproteobacteria TaxID=1236 RepID=A0A3M5DC90_PSEAI|nr:hypothetical protein ALP65_02490 [Pseudomonas aeruginosa]
MPARSQRGGQDHPAALPDGPGPGPRGPGRLGRPLAHRTQAAPAGPRRDRLRAAGTGNLPPADGGREPADGTVPFQRQGRPGGAGLHLRAVPGPARNETAPRRRPLRRPAAATGDRPRPGQPAATADPRRTHGRHPAFGDQGDRRGRPQPGGARRHGDPAGRAVLRLRRRTGRPIPGDGARRDRPAGPRPRHGERGRARAGGDLNGLGHTAAGATGACAGNLYALVFPQEVEMTVTLRPAVQADAGFAALCVAAAYAPWIAVIGRKPWPMTQDYHEVIASDRVLIAEHDGQPVGLLVTRETADGFLVDNLAVLPECKGQGIGRQLLERAERDATSLGYRSLYLYTNERMTENIELYARVGYLEYERRQEEGFRRVFMRKALA